MALHATARNTSDQFKVLFDGVGPSGSICSSTFRLDAVQDIMNHPTFEASFTDIAKGLPDLERIVSRIHSKNCRVKDFLKVLSVCAARLWYARV